MVPDDREIILRDGKSSRVSRPAQDPVDATQHPADFHAAGERFRAATHLLMWLVLARREC